MVTQIHLHLGMVAKKCLPVKHECINGIELGIRVEQSLNQLGEKSQMLKFDWAHDVIGLIES